MAMASAEMILLTVSCYLEKSVAIDSYGQHPHLLQLEHPVHPTVLDSVHPGEAATVSARSNAAARCTEYNLIGNSSN